jgi:hypothetical protein
MFSKLFDADAHSVENANFETDCLGQRRLQSIMRAFCLRHGYTQAMLISWYVA